MKKLVQISAGQGPAECAWVVAQVLKIMLDEAAVQGIAAEVLHKEVGPENGTISSVLVQIDGHELSTFLSSWLGAVQWIGQSKFRKMHQRKNWFIGVFAADDWQAQALEDSEIVYQAMRSSGAGGQHVNKVSSAVRATHLPTGISVVSMDSRSQHQNKKMARARLAEKLELQQREVVKSQFQKNWQNNQNVERGNPIRTFTGSDFKKSVPKDVKKSAQQKIKNDLKKGNYDTD